MQECNIFEIVDSSISITDRREAEYAQAIFDTLNFENNQNCLKKWRSTQRVFVKTYLKEQGLVSVRGLWIAYHYPK
jgi:hypothetical protein